MSPLHHVGKLRGVSDSLAVNIQALELYVLGSNPYFTPQDRYVTLEKFPRPLTAVTSFTVSGQHSLPPMGVVGTEL